MTITGWFRISRHGHEPWSGGVAIDPHGLNCAVDPSDFAQRVRAAVGVTPAAAPQTDPVTEEPAPADAKEDGAAIKAVNEVLNFLSTWN